MGVARGQDVGEQEDHRDRQRRAGEPDLPGAQQSPQREYRERADGRAGEQEREPGRTHAGDAGDRAQQGLVRRQRRGEHGGQRVVGVQRVPEREAAVLGDPRRLAEVVGVVDVGPDEEQRQRRERRRPRERDRRAEPRVPGHRQEGPGARQHDRGGGGEPRRPHRRPRPSREGDGAGRGERRRGRCRRRGSAAPAGVRDGRRADPAAAGHERARHDRRRERREGPARAGPEQQARVVGERPRGEREDAPLEQGVARSRRRQGHGPTLRPPAPAAHPAQG